MQTLTDEMDFVSEQAGPQSHITCQLTFAALYEQMARTRPTEPRRPWRRLAMSLSGFGIVAGLGLTIWNALPGSVPSLHMAFAGFVIELAGTAGLVLLEKPYRSARKEISDRSDMRDYDEFRIASSSALRWLAQFTIDEIVSLRATLHERCGVNDLANAWLFGQFEKLGILPAIAAVIVQCISITQPHGLIGNVASGLLVGATFAFCGMSFVVTRDQARDRRIDWLLQRAEYLKRDASTRSLAP